jgi:hypothetical protein
MVFLFWGYGWGCNLEQNPPTSCSLQAQLEQLTPYKIIRCSYNGWVVNQAFELL